MWYPHKTSHYPSFQIKMSMQVAPEIEKCTARTNFKIGVTIKSHDKSHRCGGVWRAKETM